METFLILNGYEIDASLAEQERTILGVASGQISRQEFEKWLDTHVAAR